MSNAFPSVDPADLGTLTGALRHVFKKLMQGIDGALPAQVVAADRKYATVRPLIAVVSTTGEHVARPTIERVPIMQLGGGNFIMSFKINPGDVGLIIACDRDISLYLQSLTDSAPNTFRMKNFSDSFFIPQILTSYTLAGEDADNAVLQSLDGSVKISLGANKIKIKAATVEIESTSLGITASGGMSITSPLVSVDGNITATGTITPGV